MCGLQGGIKQHKALSLLVYKFIWIQRKSFTREAKPKNEEANTECKENQAADSIRNSTLDRTDYAQHRRSSNYLERLSNTRYTVNSHQSREHMQSIMFLYG